MRIWWGDREKNFEKVIIAIGVHLKGATKGKKKQKKKNIDITKCSFEKVNKNKHFLS